MSKICLFDVNETILDMSPMDEDFQRIFGRPGIRQEWFAQFLTSALVATVTDAYSPFGLIASTSFDMIAAKYMTIVEDSDKKDVLDKINSLPPYPEVMSAIAMLKENGFIIGALTNSRLDVATAQLDNAGLSKYFNKILSADQAGRLKPAREAYQMAAESFGVSTDQIRLVSAHFWDIAGALRAGCRAAFVARYGMVLDPLVEKPDIIGDNMEDIANQIIADERQAA